MQPKEKVTNKSVVKTNDLLFISNSSVRKNIIDSIETVSFLYLVEKDKKYSGALGKEIRRIIILYSASIAEALLLYLYKTKNFSLTKTVYSDVSPLPDQFQLDKKARIVIAKQVKSEKNDRELMLDSLLNFFTDKKIIPSALVKKIEYAKNIRNTFHLSKSRSGIKIGATNVKHSTEAIYETLICVKKALI